MNLVLLSGAQLGLTVVPGFTLNLLLRSDNIDGDYGRNKRTDLATRSLYAKQLLPVPNRVDYSSRSGKERATSEETRVVN